MRSSVNIIITFQQKRVITYITYDVNRDTARFLLEVYIQDYYAGYSLHTYLLDHLITVKFGTCKG